MARGAAQVAGLALMALVALGGCAAGQPALRSEGAAAPKSAVCLSPEGTASVCPGGLYMVARRGGDTRGLRSLRTDTGGLVAAQWVDRDGDGAADTVYYKADRPLSGQRPSPKQAPNVQNGVDVVLSQRTGGRWEGGKLVGGAFADVGSIEVPGWHFPGDAWLRYEGVAWDTGIAAYRLYLDRRNGLDAFGKRVSTPALGRHGYDNESYHDVSDWGADILHVGESLGIGSPGVWRGGKARRIDGEQGIAARIIDNGPYFARFVVESKGWKPGEGDRIDVASTYSVLAGSRPTHVSVVASRAVEGWVTGFIRNPAASAIVSNDGQEWQYLASWGRQSMFNDDMGLAVFYRRADAVPSNQDKESHMILFNGSRPRIDYFLSAVWSRDTQGIDSREKFVAYLERERKWLSSGGAGAF